MELFDCTIETTAVIHSLGCTFDVVEIIGKLDTKQYIVKYRDVYCTAIFNVFNGYYYVDDKYGILKEDVVKWIKS